VFASSSAVRAVLPELVVLGRMLHLEELHQEVLWRRVVLQAVSIGRSNNRMSLQMVSSIAEHVDSPIPGGAIPGAPP